MNAEDVKIALENRFSKGHACFREFRTLTGYANARYVDFLAVGMWGKTWGIKAFEIKISKNDFIQDVAIFEHKHGDALEISHEFYYVCPWGMIDKGEVPEIAGLFYVNKSRTLHKKKQAQRRKLESISMPYFAAFAREFGHKIEHTKIPIQYLGHEISQDEFIELVEKKKDWEFKRDVDKKAKEIHEELMKEVSRLSNLRRELSNICGIGYFDENKTEKLVNHIRGLHEFWKCYQDIRKALGEMRIKIESAEIASQYQREIPSREERDADKTRE